VKTTSGKEVGELDKTFPVMLIVVTLFLVPAINPYVYSTQPANEANFLIGYFLVPLLLLLVMWWVAVFFDKINLRIVSWYGLFYFVFFSLWMLFLIVFRNLPEGNLRLALGGITVFSPFVFAVIPTHFILERYNVYTIVSRKRVTRGCLLFFFFVVCMAVLSARLAAQ
jgi:hypothetical protein